MTVRQKLDVINKKAQVSVLGALGEGAAGTPGANFISTFNASGVAASASPIFTAAPFVSRTGRVRVTANVTFSKNSGTLAAGDNVTVTLEKDAGAMGGQQRAVAATDGSDVIASASLTWIDTVTPGSSHTYGVQASGISGGHTAGILATECVLTVQDV